MKANALAFSRNPQADSDEERSHSWPSAHAWKACIPQGIKGSNPFLSAKCHHKSQLTLGFSSIESLAVIK